MNPALSSPAERQLVDDALVAYVEWREECLAVWDAYDRWVRTPPEENVSATHAAYRAALDREETAADAYAKSITRVGLRAAFRRTNRQVPQPKGAV